MVEAPALPGCYSQGETLDDALDNVKEAIALYLEALMDDDRRIPMDSDVIFHVAVPLRDNGGDRAISARIVSEGVEDGGN